MWVQMDTWINIYSKISQLQKLIITKKHNFTSYRVLRFVLFIVPDFYGKKYDPSLLRLHSICNAYYAFSPEERSWPVSSTRLSKVSSCILRCKLWLKRRSQIGNGNKSKASFLVPCKNSEAILELRSCQLRVGYYSSTSSLRNYLYKNKINYSNQIGGYFWEMSFKLTFVATKEIKNIINIK